MHRLSFVIFFTIFLMGLWPNRILAQKNEADLTAFLLNGADCVVSGSNRSYSRLYTQTQPVAINRQIFDRLFSMRAYKDGGYSTLTCRASSQNFSIVDLQLGVSDDSAQSGANMTVNIYQGGNLRHTYNSVRAGTLINVVLDLNNPEIATNPDSFAIEIFDCNAGSPDRSCYLQFVEARLYPTGSFTSFSSTSNTTNNQSPDTTLPSNQPSSSGSSRQDTGSSPEPNSSREDAPSSSSGNGILNRVINEVLDDIFN